MGGRSPRVILALLAVAACSREPRLSPASGSQRAASSAASAPRLARAAPPLASAPARPDAGVALSVERALGAPGDALGATLYRYAARETHGQLWVARALPAKTRFELIPAPRPRPLARITAAHEPAGDFASINGGFYEQNRPMGLVLAGGKELAPLSPRGGSGVFGVEAGVPFVVHRDDYQARSPSVALQSIDRLVDAGEVLVRPRPDLPRDARSALAITADGAVLLVIAFDARAAFPTSDTVIRLTPASTSTGPTLLEFAEWLAGELGARYALNLDGGFSTAMRLRIGGERHEVIAHRATINALVASARP
ncbi:MAG: phosphodiester glycosidase family protein [Sorangiineae bacterium]|nr:phosphodiester glycosidase family protein [Polyangiaceae bacterium]MEB2325109.1 phosphodiester glycosidase family protein [Sorangiineae bacterium]